VAHWITDPVLHAVYEIPGVGGEGAGRDEDAAIGTDAVQRANERLDVW
jgi:hypothetical protein